jgi:iron complex outermembrane receptor protein
LTNGLEVFGYANQTWRSDTFLNSLSEYGRQDAYGLTNLGLGLRSQTGRWSANIWARNLFDQEYNLAYGQAGASTPYIAILGDPRTIGVTLTAQVF